MNAFLTFLPIIQLHLDGLQPIRQYEVKFNIKGSRYDADTIRPLLCYTCLSVTIPVI